MEIPERLKQVCERIRLEAAAERLYVIDVVEQQADHLAGIVVFGMRNAKTPALAARLKAAQMLEEEIRQPVGTEVFSEPEEEVEYLFDRYLRPYIASHGGVCTVVTIEEEKGNVWIHMDGGCSGCPASMATLKHGIERTLKKHLPWMQRVEAVDAAQEPDFAISIDFSALAAGKQTS